ncbi:MAG: hypothetical protein FWG28_03935 [Clostridiales bacterium]|nr:hypothetical protein [Clostridiales bacterium]
MNKPRLPRIGAGIGAMCLLLPLLLLAGGCGGGLPAGDPIANVPVEREPLRLEGAELRPIIFGGEVSGARYTLQEGQIFAVARGFYLDLIFSDALDAGQILGAIQIKGPGEVVYTAAQPDPSVSGYEGMISLHVPEIEPGDYQISVSTSLTGIYALPLEEAVGISLHLDAQTEGEFFLLDSSGLPRPISYEECRFGVALSDTAKTFIIQFNQEVNQVSVQDSITAGLRDQPAIVAFSWMTPQQLRVNLTQLQTGMSYHLALGQGIDSKGNGVLGSCYFRTGKASNVGAILLATNEMNMIYQFSEERFSGFRSQMINSRVILQAGNSITVCFGLGARQIFSLPVLRYDLAMPQSYREPVWVDYDHLLGYNAQDKTLYLVSAPSGETSPVYTLPEHPLECRLSPGGRLLAVAYRASSDNRRVDLLMIDIQKKALLDHARSFAQPYITPAGYSALNITWSGADAFLYADGDDILRAYISAEGKIGDRRNTIEKDSRILDYYPESNALLCRPIDMGTGSLYLIQDNKSRRLKDFYTQERDFYCVLVDEETILFQSGEEICRYSIAEQETELVGGGLLLGVSTARDKAYYMVNAEDYGRSAP